MPMLQPINIPDDAKHAIVNGIFSAITQDIPDIIQEYNLPTSNGIGLFKWNCIHKRIQDNLGGRFQLNYPCRGGWKLLLLYEQDLEFTISIMSEKNFATLQEHLPRNIHYLEALISKNTNSEIAEGQLWLEGIKPQRDASALEKLRNNLLSDFVGIINNHLLILFDYNYNDVVSARAVLLNHGLGITYSEDWSAFLKKPYIIGKASIIEEMIDDEALTLVYLKTEKFDSNLDLVSIANEYDIAKK